MRTLQLVKITPRFIYAMDRGNPMRVGIDIDDTFVNMDVIERVLGKYGYGSEVVTTFRVNDLDIEQHIKDEIISEFINPDIMCNLKPNIGAVELVKYLSDIGAVVYAITARRHDYLGRETIKMMETLAPTLSGVYFVGGGRKSEIINMLKLDIMIDDAPYVFDDMLENCSKVMKFLISNHLTPHNHGYVEMIRSEDMPITVFSSLHEIRDFLTFFRAENG